MFIYKITNTRNRKSYIGQTRSSIKYRWSLHINDARWKKTALANAIRKYGKDAFTIEILYEASSELELNMCERGLIAQYGTLAPNGYNLTCGGEKISFIPSTETRNKISSALKGRDNTPAVEAARLVVTGMKRSKESVARSVVGRRNWVTDKNGPEFIQKIREIKRRLLNGEGIYAIARHYKIADSTVEQIKYRNDYHWVEPSTRPYLKLPGKMKLKPEVVKRIQIRLQSGAKQTLIAKEFSVSDATISIIKHRLNRKAA